MNSNQRDVKSEISVGNFTSNSDCLSNKCLKNDENPIARCDSLNSLIII